MPPKRGQGSKRGRNESIGASSSQPPSNSNDPQGPKGTPKSCILPGAYISNELHESKVWDLCCKQNWLKFFQLPIEVDELLVETFYKNVRITVNGDNLALEYEFNGVRRRYTHVDFKEDFDIKNEGYKEYIVGSFPGSQEYVREVFKFNHGKYPPN